MSDEEKKKRSPLPFEPPELPDPLEIIEEVESKLEEAETVLTSFDEKAKEIDKKTREIDRKFTRPPSVTKLLTKPKPKQSAPESGKSFEGQSDESYCLECIERHTMKSLTETRHAIDRFRTAGKMTSGATEKIKIAFGEIEGIDADVISTKNASPEVKKGLDEILDGVRWIVKEYGIAGRGLTRGFGTMEDLEDFKAQILILQNKAYVLVENCPTCEPHVKKAIGKALEERVKSGREA